MEEQTACQCGGASDLFDAAKKGCEDCCRRMSGQARQTRDDIHFYEWNDRKNRTALMVAAYHGKTECVRILAEKEVGMQDEYNNTALMVAAREGHLECVKILSDFEAGMQDDKGKTALMYAAEEGKKECVNALLDKEKDMTNKDGHNARWYATGECKEILAKIESCACKDLFDAAHYGCEEHCK